MRFRPLLLLGLASLTLAASAWAADKSGYWLFSPTPEALMREFDTDRPDKTNSPHTLDAGHVQLEMDLFALSHDRHNPERSPTQVENWTWANANIRVGVTNWADLQLLLTFYQMNREKDLPTGDLTRKAGIGDFTAVLKMNFWGNDGGKTAGGLEFFVKAPTATHGLGNGRVEGGALLLFEAELPGDFELGINSGVTINANDSDNGHHAEIINSASVSRKIYGPLSAYAEFFSDVNTQHGAPWVGTVDLGFLLMLGKNVQLDTGVNLGVTRAAPDVQTFVGLSIRF